MKPTGEQIAIRDSKAKTLLVSAGAGAAKTTTLVLYAQARPETNMLYLAFNRPVKEEAQRKFPKNVRCVTTHALAFPSHGKLYQAKLGNPKAYQIAQALGVQQRDGGVILNIVTNFLISGDREIGEVHTRGESVADWQRPQFIEQAKRAWQMMCDTGNMNVPMPHDGYLKLYQLSNPKIRAEVILFDEAQDANPVTLAIVEAQTCGKVFVGDSRQSIYGFRGAVNAMDIIKADEHLHLTQSFRYGHGVARIANTVLGAYEPLPHPIRGAGKHETRFAVDATKPHTVLSRTNASLFGEAVAALKSGVPFAFVGGVGNYKFDVILDTFNLSVNRRDLIKDKMIMSFADFAEMTAYGESLDDKEVKSLVRIVNEYGSAIPNLIERITREAVAEPTGNEILMTTAHKAKGLEFMDVRLTDDFTDMQEQRDNEDRMIPPEREEINLLYVAMTRALRGLSVHPSMMEWLEKANRNLYWEIRTHQREQRDALEGAPEVEVVETAIETSRDNRGLLESFGVTLGAYDESSGTFAAKIPLPALAKLQQFPADFRVRDPGDRREVCAGEPPALPVAPDVTKPLYDSDGYQHHYVTGNDVEIVTKIGSVFALWDAKTGECLKTGSDGIRIGNVPLSDEELARRHAEGERILAELRTAAARQAAPVVESYML